MPSASIGITFSDLGYRLPDEVLWNELKAREAKIGIWAGEFIAPWDWRQGLRLDGEPPTKAMLDGKFDAD